MRAGAGWVAFHRFADFGGICVGRECASAELESRDIRYDQQQVWGFTLSGRVGERMKCDSFVNSLNLQLHNKEAYSITD